MLELFFLYWRSLRRFKKSSWGKNSLFMILGLIIAVGALTLAMILFDSYEKTLNIAFKNSRPDLILNRNSEEISDKEEEELQNILANFTDKIKAYSPQEKIEVIMSFADKNKPAYLESFDNANSIFNKYMYSFARVDSFYLADNEIILGEYLAKELSLSPGDEVEVILPSSIRYSIFGLTKKSGKLLVKSINKTGLYDIDAARAIVSIACLKGLRTSKYGKNYSIILNDRTRETAKEISYQLNSIFRKSLTSYYASDLISYDSTLFSALALQKLMIFLILCIIVIVAAFNVISTISTIINEKIEEIGILMTLGLKKRDVKLLYYFFSLIITHIGILIGLIMGYVSAYVLTHQDFLTLKGDIYFIDKIAINPSLTTLLLIYATSVIIISTTILLSLRSINKVEIINIMRR